MSNRTPPLRPREIAAMLECKARIAAGERMGTRKIASMQRAERAGLVQRIERNGLIVDWTLTEAGEAW